MFTYKKTPYKIFTLGPKFCWADPKHIIDYEINLKYTIQIFIFFKLFVIEYQLM